MLSVLMLAGCGAEKAEKNKEGKETMNISTEKVSETEYFHELWKEDEQGDGKSVYWDGEKAFLIEDPLDSLDITDGRLVVEGTEMKTVPGIFELHYLNKLKNVQVVSEKEDDYHLTAENMDIRVQEVDFSGEKERLDKDSGYRSMETDVLSQHQIKYFKEYGLYMGLADTEKGRYAGYTLIFKSELNGKSYKLSVLGIGNMEDIKMHALYVMNHFEVLF